MTKSTEHHNILLYLISEEDVISNILLDNLLYKDLVNKPRLYQPYLSFISTLKLCMKISFTHIVDQLTKQQTLISCIYSILIPKQLMLCVQQAFLAPQNSIQRGQPVQEYHRKVKTVFNYQINMLMINLSIRKRRHA